MRDRKQVFLDELSKHGVVAWAAKAASPFAKHSCARTFTDEAARDPFFAEAMRVAKERAAAELLVEARRRAVQGVERVVVQRGAIVKDERGNPLVERQYSDRLLEVLLKASHPHQFREVRENINRTIPDDAHCVIGLQDMMALDDERRRQLTEILAIIARSRGVPIEHEEVTT